ncbi:MAG TPA: hypothetical protein VFO01_11325 [Trebonia sp.]|nr:hypothetical protein [Trebonia sp.]
MQELTLRHRARTMLIVCPAGLTLQWRDEMRDKFGLDFRIVDTAALKELRRSRGAYANPWTHYPRLIVSIDWLKRDRPMRRLREILPAVPRYPRTFDLLVVDEVHTCAPQARGRYATDSLRTSAVRALAPHCEHRLFLSATPHNGYLESFTALLEMLDDHRFMRGVKPDEEQLRRIMVRRMKRELPPNWDGTPRFPVRSASRKHARNSHIPPPPSKPSPGNRRSPSSRPASTEPPPRPGDRKERKPDRPAARGTARPPQRHAGRSHARTPPGSRHQDTDRT